MIIPYSLTDLGAANANPDWKKDKINLFKADRDASFDKTKIQKWVKDKDGDTTGNFVYRHFVPYNWIFDAITETLENKTRGEIIQFLQDWTNALEIKPADTDTQLPNDPWKSRVDYDTWVEWSIESICDWRLNIYYGPGIGDAGGTRLDYPTSATKKKDQTDRVQHAANKLVENITALEKHIELNNPF